MNVRNLDIEIVVVDIEVRLITKSQIGMLHRETVKKIIKCCIFVVICWPSLDF